MEKKTMKDMTSGSPMKLILGFLIPMLFGLLFQQFYNMMDTIIVGKYLGVQALAAVGSTGSVNFMIIGFCTGVCSGFAIPVAQKFGERNETALRRYVANGGWLAVGFSLVMTVIVCVLCRPILVLMQTPEDIIDGAYAYILVIFLGIPATYLYNLLAGIIRSLGDSKTPLFFFDDIFFHEHCTGSVYHSGAGYGGGRSCVGDCDLSGSIRSTLSDLYEEKIRDSENAGR